MPADLRNRTARGHTLPLCSPRRGMRATGTCASPIARHAKVLATSCSVPNWFTYCEILPELPSLQGWIEAMTSLGRLIFFDQPGTGASDPVTPGAMPTLEQWADSITAVLDDLGSSEAVLVASNGAFAPAALFAATHPSRTTALVVLDGYADAGGPHSFERKRRAATRDMWGTGEIQHLMNPDMPWNEEIRATWARMERLAASPATRALMMPLMTEVDVRAVLPTIRVPTLVVHHAEDAIIPPAKGRYIAEHIPGAKYVELPGRNLYHSVEPWRRVLPGDRRVPHRRPSRSGRRSGSRHRVVHRHRGLDAAGRRDR